MEKYQAIERADICQAIISKHRPFEGRMLQQVKDFYKIDLTWSSNALEGNTLTISETKIILEDGITIGGKPMVDILEAAGHGKAYDYIFTLLNKDKIEINDMKKIHKLFYSGIDPEEAGVYRKEEALVTGSKYEVASPADIDRKMTDLQEWIINDGKQLHPIEFAAELHRRFVYIHPFTDGNGRTARLMMNLALMQGGFLPCIISPVVRSQYVAALEAAHKNKDIFTLFVADQSTETMKDFIRNMHMEKPVFPQYENEKPSYKSEDLRSDYLNDMDIER